MKRINLLSGPRNISTALMYSFAQRIDTAVVDEPLYGHYLKVTDADHPGKEEILSNTETDGNKVIQNIISGDYEKNIVLFKQMTHHLTGLDESFLELITNVLLIRDPEYIIVSLAKVLKNVKIRDTGIIKQYQIYKKLTSLNKKPVIIDSGEILKDPEKALRSLCNVLEIPFDSNMLSWKAGKRKEDGIWAKYWYENVHQSTGFQKINTAYRKMPDELLPLYDECKPYYEELSAESIRV